MIRRIILHSSILSVVACFVTLLLTPVQWHIDIGTRDAQRYTTSLREAESAPITQHDQTFQWVMPDSHIVLTEPSRQHILTLMTMQRGEQPPRTITLTLARQEYSIPENPGIRRLRLLAPASPTLGITCDNRAVTNVTLHDLCLAIVSLDSQRLGWALDRTTLAWLLFLALAISVVSVLSLAEQPRLSMVAALTLLAIALSFPQALSVSFPGLLAILVGWLGALLCIRWRVSTAWLRIALIAMCANIVLKASGIVSPGYYGTDIGFHVHKYEAILRTHFYQVADGQGLTYPYPPTVYYLLALVALPLQWLWPLERIIHLSAVVIDSTTILLLGWLAQRNGWSLRRIALVSTLYVILPAGFLLQWQATVAQTIGQWFAVIAIVTALADVGVVSTIAMTAAMVGHFGSFLTLHLTYTLAFMRRSLRPLAWRWWVLFVVVGTVYFSQFWGTILAQLGALQNIDDTSTISQRWWQFAWQYGLYGHYNGIFVAFMVIGLCMLRPDRLRAFGWLMVLSSTLLLLAQVLADIDTTRYVIALFPLVVLAGAVPLAALWRSRAGRILVIGLVGLIVVQSSTAWYAGVINGVRLGFLW